MQKIIIPILLMISLNGYSQLHFDSSSTYIATSTGSFGYSIVHDSSGAEIYLMDNGKLEIYGDSTKAIKLLFKEWQKQQEKYWNARAVLDHINLDVLARLFKDKSFTRVVNEYKKSEKNQ